MDSRSSSSTILRRNTYTYEMMRQLDDAILQARFDDNVHVIVLRGHGDKILLRGRQHCHAHKVTPGSSISSAWQCWRPRRRIVAVTTQHDHVHIVVEARLQDRVVELAIIS